MMRFAMWVGCACLGASVLACAGLNREVALPEEHPVGASSGAGGAAEIDTGRWAKLAEAPAVIRERQRLYEQVAQELGLDDAPATTREALSWIQEAVGGGGQAGAERLGCAEVLAANEPAAVLSGTLDFAGDGLLTVNVPGKGPIKLRTDESTCAVQARQVRSPESLLEGTEVRVAYGMKVGLPTARVVRAEPVVYTR
jgi:hypothetical protein